MQVPLVVRLQAHPDTECISNQLSEKQKNAMAERFGCAWRFQLQGIVGLCSECMVTATSLTGGRFGLFSHGPAAYCACLLQATHQKSGVRAVMEVAVKLDSWMYVHEANAGDGDEDWSGTRRR